MRPDPIESRPFFRPEAEQYRRLRSFGSIDLFRPLPVRLVTLLPLGALMMVMLIAVNLRVAPRVELAASPALMANDGLELLLTTGDPHYFQVGGKIKLIGASGRISGARITSAIAVRCTVPTRSSHCLRIQIKALTSLPIEPLVAVRGVPRKLFSLSS